MFKKLLLNSLFIFGFSSVIIAQTEILLLKNYKKVDKKITAVKDSFASITELGDYINKNFENDEYKCRAIYKWITSQVVYDVKLMYSLNLKIKKGELAESAFKVKKAICMGYALLFDSLCALSNIKCQYIVGSTKQFWLAEPTGHAWNAVNINNTWYLVDPTWGAGYIEQGKFIKSLSNDYFLADGKSFYPSHHPIDAIWQLIEFPHDLYFFYNQSAKKTTSLKWNYNDSIEAYLKQLPIDQTVSTQRRLKLNGTNSNFTSDYYRYLESLKGYYVSKELKKVSELITNIINEYNTYIKFKNNQFNPETSDDELKRIFDKASNYLVEGNKLIIQTKNYNSEIQNEVITKYKTKLDELEEKIAFEGEFVNKFISTEKSKRKTLFKSKD